MRYVAAFRTYTWDEGARELARRFFAATKGARQVVLADESRGALGIAGYEVLSHTDQTEDLGLPVVPAQGSLWFNVDYGLYILRARLPDFDYYMTSESDLAVNLDLSPIMFKVAHRQIDMVAHEIIPSTSDWHWHKNGLETFEIPWRSLLFFMIASAQAVDTLWTARRQQGLAYRAGSMSSWPFCEPFVPSILKAAGMRFADIAEFAETKHLRFRPRLALHDARANVPGSLAHSVLATPAYLRSVIADYGPYNWFASDGQLQDALEGFEVEEFSGMIESAFLSDLAHAAFQEFRRQMLCRGLSPQPANDLASCKPALSSSTSQWSHYPDVQKDAAGAVAKHFPDEFGFHTALQVSPWWLVDLLGSYLIESISIVNRRSYPCRFRQFVVESSLDSSLWITRFIKLDMCDVSNERDSPFWINITDSFVARFVRIRLLGEGILHLRRVEVFGRLL